MNQKQASDISKAYVEALKKVQAKYPGKRATKEMLDEAGELAKGSFNQKQAQVKIAKAVKRIQAKQATVVPTRPEGVAVGGPLPPFDYDWNHLVANRLNALPGAGVFGGALNVLDKAEDLARLAHNFKLKPPVQGYEDPNPPRIRMWDGDKNPNPTRNSFEPEPIAPLALAHLHPSPLQRYSNPEVYNEETAARSNLKPGTQQSVIMRNVGNAVGLVPGMGGLGSAMRGAGAAIGANNALSHKNDISTLNSINNKKPPIPVPAPAPAVKKSDLETTLRGMIPGTSELRNRVQMARNADVSAGRLAGGFGGAGFGALLGIPTGALLAPRDTVDGKKKRNLGNMVAGGLVGGVAGGGLGALGGAPLGGWAAGQNFDSANQDLIAALGKQSAYNIATRVLDGIRKYAPKVKAVAKANMPSAKNVAKGVGVGAGVVGGTELLRQGLNKGQEMIDAKQHPERLNRGTTATMTQENPGMVDSAMGWAKAHPTELMGAGGGAMLGAMAPALFRGKKENEEDGPGLGSALLGAGLGAGVGYGGGYLAKALMAPGGTVPPYTLLT